jgi:hypothetical protein
MEETPANQKRTRFSDAGGTDTGNNPNHPNLVRFIFDTEQHDEC